MWKRKKQGLLAPVAALVMLASQFWMPSRAIESTVASNIPTVVWKNPQKPTKAALLCIHGLSLHKQTYATLGQKMADAGVVTYAIDVRGFGDWVTKKNQRNLDFDAALVDIRQTLERIHKEVPGVPVFIMGESMGGGLAVHAMANNPDLLDGLISSCPASERYHQGSTSLKVAMHAITQGMHSQMGLGSTVIDNATKKQDLKSAWINDPQARLSLSPVELLKFQHCMDENDEYAQKITTAPVLFIQGCEDKLVRPAGTWRLFDFITSPKREIVLSKTAEHLIFEESQFSEDDLKFVLDWMNKTMTAKAESAKAAAAAIAAKSGTAGQLSFSTDALKAAVPLQLDYWIELHRGKTTYRVTNKAAFQSGDEISFHVIPHEDGYAYIVLTGGSSGSQAVLFPSPETGLNNKLQKEKDYILPTTTRLLFDKTAGIERVSIVYSKVPIDAHAYLQKTKNSPELIAYVSADRSGAKDLVPTRMQLTWEDDSSSLISPNDAAAQANRRLVKLSDHGGNGVLAVDIALEHR